MTPHRPAASASPRPAKVRAGTGGSACSRENEVYSCDTDLMARRFALLSDRQLQVLRWVGDGCPDGVWEDSGYKHSAYALADRGLVTVERNGHSWRAVITDDGRYYLEQGEYRTADARGSRRAPAHSARASAAQSPSPQVPFVTAKSLLAELASGGGVLTVQDPPGTVRAAYRRAISRAITDSLVPDGYGLRHAGRDRGDLVVSLVSVRGEPAQSEPLPAIPVPGTLQGCHNAVAALRDTPGLMDVSGEARQRALLIAQAIAGECARRGYEFALRGGGEPSFQITINDDAFGFTLSEEFERREVADGEKLAAAKYAWQRIPSSGRRVRSGRLVLRLGSGYGSVFWADRKRQTLGQKLPQMFQDIAVRAAAAAEARRREEEERRRRRRAWEDAMPRARQAYIDQLNRDRLREQAARSAEAGAIREYCARLDSLAKACDDLGRAEDIREWVTWARQEADRVDPVTHPDRLIYVVPEEVRPSDLEKFMPSGLTARHLPLLAQGIGVAEHLHWGAEFALQPGRLRLAAGWPQRVDRQLGDLTHAADFLTELGQFVEAISAFGTAPRAQHLAAGAQVIVVERDTAPGLEVMFAAAPPTAGPAAVDRLVPGLPLLVRHVLQDRSRVLEGGGRHDELGHLPRRDQHAVLGERQRMANELLRVHAKPGGHAGGVADADCPGLAVPDRDLTVAEEHLDDRLGGIFSRIIQRKARRVDPVPAFLTGPVAGDVLPQHLEPRGRHPLLAALEHVIGEPDQDPRRPLCPQPNDRHLGKLVGLPGPVRPRLTGPHRARTLWIWTGMGHGQTSHRLRFRLAPLAPGYSIRVAVSCLMTSSIGRLEALFRSAIAILQDDTLGSGDMVPPQCGLQCRRGPQESRDELSLLVDEG